MLLKSFGHAVAVHSISMSGFLALGSVEPISPKDLM